MLKTYHGSCHCRAIAFEADLDLSQGTSRCNCSVCRKLRQWSASTTPEHFRLTKGESALGQFRPTPDNPNAHCFCSICGVRVFSKGDLPELGGPFVTVAVAALDDATAEEIIAAPLQWMDGLHDAWWNPPEEVRHL